MTHPIVERRRGEQRDRLERARQWADLLASRLAVDAVIVFGSTARGDFNKWSDIDVLVVAPQLPDGARARLDLLMADTPPGIQPVGWTPLELERRRSRHDPIAVECDSIGVEVLGSLPPGAPPPSRPVAPLTDVLAGLAEDRSDR